MVPFSFMVSVRARAVVLHPIFPHFLIFDLTEAPAGRSILPYSLHINTLYKINYVKNEKTVN